MDTTRLSQRRPRRPPSRSKLSRHYPRPVAGHDPWSLSEQGRRGSKFPFSASFRSASPPTPPSSLPPPPPLAPYPALLLIHPPLAPKVCDAPDGRRGQGFRTSSHTTTSLFVPRRRIRQKKALGLLPQKGLDVRPEVEVGVIWILVDCGKGAGLALCLLALLPPAGDRKQLTSSALCRRRRGGRLGLGVGLLGLGDQLLLVLVLVLGGGRALRRRDCPLVVEAVEDAEAEGRVSEDLEEAGGRC